MTSALKAKVFGLNAAKPYGIDLAKIAGIQSKDQFAIAKANAVNNADPHFLTFGPKNRREFLAFRKADGGAKI